MYPRFTPGLEKSSVDTKRGKKIALEKMHTRFAWLCFLSNHHITGSCWGTARIAKDSSPRNQHVTGERLIPRLSDQPATQSFKFNHLPTRRGRVRRQEQRAVQAARGKMGSVGVSARSL